MRRPTYEDVIITSIACKATASGMCIKNWGTTLVCMCKECSKIDVEKCVKFWDSILEEAKSK